MDSINEWLDLARLSPEKLQPIEDTLSAILTLSSAIDTFAQIIDGTPTRTSFYRNYGPPGDDSTVSERLEPSDAAIQMYSNVRTAFSAQDLRMPTQVCFFEIYTCRKLYPHTLEHNGLFYHPSCAVVVPIVLNMSDPSRQALLRSYVRNTVY